MSGYVAGFNYCQIFVRDSSGNCTGQQDTLANGSTSGTYVSFDVKTAGLNPVPPNNLNIQGGDKTRAVIQFGGPKQGAFDLVISAYDNTLSDFISGATSNTVNSQVTYTSENPNRTFPRILGLCLTQIFQQQDGTLKYLSRIFPTVFMRYRQGQAAFQAESDITINVTPNYSTTAVDSRKFDNSTNGLNLNLEEAKTDNLVRITANPFHIMAFRQDGTATTITTTYKPISSTVTLNATENEFVIGGVPTALSSISTSTSVATLAAAGSAAVADVLYYATKFAQ